MGWGEGARWLRAVERPRALAGAPFAAVSGRLAIADSVPTRMRLRYEAVTPSAAARSFLKARRCIGWTALNGFIGLQRSG